MYSGADYFQAQRVRRAGAAAVGELFGTVDAIVLPTSMFPAPVLGAPRTVAAPFTSRPVVLPTPAFDALGIPALSVPMGFSDDVLPLGLQIVGRLGNDAGVLRIGDAFQRLTDWHGRIAPMHSSAPEADEAVAKATSVDEADRRAVTRIMDAAGLPITEAEVDALAAGYPTIRAVTNALHRVTWDGDDAPSKAVFAIDGMRGTDDGAR
jgi:aspartyl-tRNA(Asn)/glutamyl-tRNA(Gln) amidotransferase subunit A